MANYTLDENYNNKTPLRKFWPIVKENFAKLLSWFNAHVSGTADRHKAEHIDYDSSATVKQKIAQEITDRQNGDSVLQNKITAETTNRQNADKAITDSINSHKNSNTLDHPDGSVTNEKLANGSVTREKISDVLWAEISSASGGAAYESVLNKEIDSCLGYGEYVGNFVTNSFDGFFGEITNSGLPSDGENTFDCGILIVKSTTNCYDVGLSDGGYVIEQTFIPHQTGAFDHPIPKLLKRHGTVEIVFMQDDDGAYDDYRLKWSDWYVDDFMAASNHTHTAADVTMSDGTTVESAIMEKALYGACMQNNILHITQFDGRDIQVNLPISKSADIVIAAYDAPDNWQAGADYVCDGKADDVEINAAINALGSNGGKILLSTGTFYITNHIFLDNNATIEGMGDSTRLCTATNLYQYGTTNNRALFCNNSFSNNGTKYIINIKNLKICNNYSLCDSIIHNLNKRTRLQNVTLTSSYSVPANLGYTARSFTYSDNPGCLWGTGSNDSGDELTEIIDCRVLTDYAVSWSVGSQFIIDRCIFSGFATISASGYYTTLRVLSSSPYSISSTHITINITGSNNVVYRCPSCTITDTGSNNVIS